MEDINGVPVDEYLGPTFSINQHNSDGDVYENGVYLHYGHTSIRVAKTLRGFKAHIRHLESMVDEIAEISPQPVVQADANNNCPTCGEPEPVLYCENCGYRWFM